MTALVQDSAHIVCYCRDGSWWMLPPSAHDDFLAAWQAGKPFWSGLNGWGERLTIKLADITGVVEKTEASIAMLEAESREKRSRDALEGS